jgi:phosphopantetheinyl transferase
VPEDARFGSALFRGPRIGTERPYLQAAPEGFDFNLSPYEGLAVCAFSTRGRVGVDGRARPSVGLLRLRLSLHGRERRGVENAESREEEFFELWMKEA